MNKLFLLLAAGSIALSASAQTPVGPVKGQFKVDDGSFKKNLNPISRVSQRAGTANKGTAAATGEWFIFNNCNYDVTGSGAGVTSAYIPTYPDSSIRVVPTSGTPFYWWNHGMGVSFDPTSTFFSTAYAGASGGNPTFRVRTESYTIDSIDILGYYDRVKNYTDTLYIDIVAAPDSNAFLVSWRGASLQSYGITEDTTLTLADPYYDGPSNSILPARVPSVQRITKVLDLAAFNDTTSFGAHEWTFAVTPALNVPGGSKVIAYTHFASGYRYPFNTLIDSANMWRHFTQDFAPAALQLATDANGGLFSTTEDKYVLTGKTTLGGVQPILTPTYFYTPAYVHNPFYAFHLKCPTCPPLATPTIVEANGTEVSATPNPADNVININYNFNAATSGNITLANSIGQIVATQSFSNASGKATFNAATLANGVYIYTINAGGNRTTGRVVVAH